MKKILYIVSTLKRSGPTNQLFNIIKNLNPNLFEPYLITLSPETSDSRWADYELIGVKMQSLRLTRLKGLFFAKYKLNKLVEEINPALIHTQGVRADVLASHLSFSGSCLATVRNFPQLDLVMTYGYILGRWMVWSQIKALSKLTRVVGVSSSVVKNLNANFSIKNTSVIQNGVDIEQYYPVSNAEKSTLRNKLKLPLKANIWIVSGHLSERKDPVFLINAWGNQFEIGGNNYLLLIGGGPLQDACESLVGINSNILVVGRVSNVTEYLQASDYYISSSKAEGLPNAALEAMASGLPVLLSDIEPHKEIYAMSYNIGELFSLGKQKCFIDSFMKLKSSDFELQSNSVVQLISEKLSAQKMSENYQDIYKELVGI